MNTRDVLGQLLGGASSSSGRTGSGPGGLLSGLGGAGGLDKGRTGGMGGGLAAGVIGMLLGGRSGRGIGGLATLGSLAWQAYSAWQARSADASRSAPPPAQALFAEPSETTSQAVLAAVIVAAQADGEISAEEHEHLLAMATDEETGRWVQQHLDEPLSVDDLAALATSPEIATHMYAASVWVSRDLISRDINPLERLHLDALAQALKLDADLCRSLESEVRHAVH